MVCSDCNLISNYLKIPCPDCMSPSTPMMEDTVATQKKILHQVRVPASLYNMNLAAFTIGSERLRRPVTWNQSSDRYLPAQQTAYHPTHGDSTKRTLTSMVPGSQAPGGLGVDIKHNSYHRYLGRKKASNLRMLKPNSSVIVPISGNKIKAYSLNNTENCNC